MLRVVHGGVRLAGICLALAMLTQFAVPATVSNAAADTFTFAKTMLDLGHGPCVAPTPPRSVPAGTYSTTLASVANGDCIAIHIAITNNGTSPTRLPA